MGGGGSGRVDRWLIDRVLLFTYIRNYIFLDNTYVDVIMWLTILYYIIMKSMDAGTSHTHNVCIRTYMPYKIIILLFFMFYRPKHQ